MSQTQPESRSTEPSAPDGARVLKVEEVAKMLRVDRNLIYELIHRGELPAIRLGRLMRVPIDGLEEWMHDKSRMTLKEGA